MKQSRSSHKSPPIDFEQVEPITRFPEGQSTGGVTLKGFDAWCYNQYQKLCGELRVFLEGLNTAMLESRDSDAIQRLVSDYIRDKKYPEFSTGVDRRLFDIEESITKLFSGLKYDEWELFFSRNVPFYDTGDTLLELLVVAEQAFYALSVTLGVKRQGRFGEVVERRSRYVSLRPFGDILCREYLITAPFKKGGRLRAFWKDVPCIPVSKRGLYGTFVHAVSSFCEEIYFEFLRMMGDTFADRTRPSIDMTVPGRSFRMGTLHPITQTVEDMYAIFQSLGFSIQYGPEIEEEYYNFDALNIPAGHPARNEEDSFYILGGGCSGSGRLLRTHTSPVQIRVMEKQKPPLAIITTGRCFRQDAIDATHNPSFYQLEGFQVDQGISFAHLKGILTVFARRFFGEATQVRFRPDYFPFTTPSAEFAVSCFVCGGKGFSSEGKECSTCSDSGFIEVGGCGLIDPKVFDAVNIDHSYSGYAFGIGVDRLVMTKYKIPDIRILYQNDIRFLKQFV